MTDDVSPDPQRGPAAETPSVISRLAQNWSPLDAWQAMFAAAPVASSLRDLDNRHVFTNQAYLDLFGYDADEIGSVSVEALTHPDEHATASAQLRSLLRGEIERYEVDKRYLRKSGGSFIGHLSAAVLRDASGRPQAVLATIEDVTERREARRALEARESWFRALVQNATDGIVVVDSDARLIYASPSAERLIELSVEDWLGESVLDFVHPDDHLIAAQTFATTTTTPGVGEPLRMRVLRPDGTVRYVEVVSTNLLDDPAVRGIVINIRDLTDTEEVMSVLEMTESRFRHMIENISDTVTLLDGQAQVILSTGNLRSIMGYPTDFWEDRNAFDLVHPDDLDRVRDSFLELLASPGQELAGEVRTQIANGDWIDVEINAVNLLDDADVQAIVLTTRNVTDRRRSERELAEARDQAVQALRMRTEFIASVSHELRTPIHGILGLSELLATADLDDEARALARSIGRATESLRMVLDDILDFSKIEVGRLEVNQGPFDALEMADDMESLFGPQARAKGIRLVREIGPGIPKWIMGDALRIRQVLNNLVGNAIKFTAEGEVSLRAEREDLAEGEGVADQDVDTTAWLRVTVTDTGIGIPTDAHDRLFEPFSQVHGTVTRDFGGTGLGLSIAKRLVELMGGTLGFSSELGRGSTFWFRLPLVAADVREVSPSRPSLAPRFEHDAGVVLVVEDNPINQLLVKRQLDRLGYASLVVESGVAALGLFPAIGTDLVLMDWQLPGIDGLETTRRWRELESDEGLAPRPIIAMTASALPGDRDRCLAAGMDDFIAKPVSMQTLGEVLSRWSVGRSVAEDDPQRAADVATTDPVASASATGVRLDEQSVPIDDPAPVVDATRASGAEDETSPMFREAMGEPAAIDIHALDRLVEELADPSLVVTVMRTYLRELQPRVDAILGAMVKTDRSTLAAAAHVLKSTSAAVGAETLAASCARLEQHAHVHFDDRSLPSPEELVEQAAAVRERLEVELGRLEPAVVVPPSRG